MNKHVHFDSVPNFRDLGGLRTRDGRVVAWRRLYRCASLHVMSPPDVAKLKEDVRPRAVIDLRTVREETRQREISLLDEVGARYHNVPFRPDSREAVRREIDLFRDATDLADLYWHRIHEADAGKKLVEALELIADPNNHPLIFHCSVGKDRTGVLAALLLETAGVIDEDIVDDYTLTAPFVRVIRDRLTSDPTAPPEVKDLPESHWGASAESMVRFLARLRRDHGSAANFLRAHGADSSLPRRLEEAVLG
jgi:protein-tyrosine phosphatase